MPPWDTILVLGLQRGGVSDETRRPASSYLAGSLRQNFLHDVAVEIGEAHVATAESVGEAFVIETEEVEDGGVPVVDVDFSFDGCL